MTTLDVASQPAPRKRRARAYAWLVLAVAVLLYGSAAVDFWWNRRDLLVTLEREGLLTSYWIARAGQISIAAGGQHHRMLESGTRLLLRLLDVSAGATVPGLPPVVQLDGASGRTLWRSESANAIPSDLIEYLASQPDQLRRAAHLTGAEVPFLDERQALILEPGANGSAWVAQVEETREEAGLSAMIHEMPLGGDIAYFALQDQKGIIAATPNVEKLERIEQSEFLRGVLAGGHAATREIELAGKPVLEIARVFPAGERTLLRVGMSLDGLASIQMKALVRLTVSTGVIVLGVAILLGYMLSQQHLDALDRAYRKIETESRSIIDGISDGLLAVNAEGRIVLSNPAAARILGISSLDGRQVKEVAMFCEKPEAELETDEPRVVRLDSGTELEISCTQLAEGRIILMRDVTQLRRAERSLAESEKLAFLGRMASELAHEIRNPLNAISMSAQMLEREGPQPALSGMIRGETERLNRLVQGFLGFRSIPDEPWTDVDLSEIVMEVADMFSPDAAARQVQIASDSVSARLQGRRDRLKQALINIVKNALEAAPRGGQCRITLTRDTADRVRIEVADTGPGIPKEQRKRVFEPFVTMKPGGTGIGLSIAGLIIREHGGEIEVGDSDLGGALIVITLPQGVRR